MATVEKFNTHPYTTFILTPDIDNLREMNKPAILGIIWNDGDQEQDATLAVIGKSQVPHLVKGDDEPRYYIRTWYDHDPVYSDEIGAFFQKHYAEILNKINKGTFEYLEDAIKLITDYIKEVF